MVTTLSLPNQPSIHSPKQSPTFSLAGEPSGFQSFGSSVNLADTETPANCPKFDGDNPQMWKSNCEAYFEVYNVHPVNWVRMAVLNFTGNEAFWHQSMREQLVGIFWVELCDKVCSRFSKDRHQALIKQWFHIKQLNSVTEYVEAFDALMHKLLAYDNTLLPVYFVMSFVEGLKPEIRSVVLVQWPTVLDAACALAIFQEEALECTKKGEYKSPGYSKIGQKGGVPLPLPPVPRT